jgi:hypothetical protein
VAEIQKTRAVAGTAQSRRASGPLQYSGIHEDLMAAYSCYRAAKETKSGDVPIVRW